MGWTGLAGWSAPLTVTSMVSDQHGHACGLGDIAEHARSVDRVGNRFFDEHRHACGDAFECLRRVQLIGRRKHDSIGRRVGERLSERCESRRVERTRVVGRRGRRVDDRRQHTVFALPDQFDVTPADHTGAGDRDAQPRVRHASRERRITRAQRARARA